MYKREFIVSDDMMMSQTKGVITGEEFETYFGSTMAFLNFNPIGDLI